MNDVISDKMTKVEQKVANIIDNLHNAPSDKSQGTCRRLAGKEDF